MRGTAEEFGPYVVYEQIGLGGMATVHRAEAQGIAGFSKQVALKRMLPNVAADANLVRSFIREARLASHLRHANVAQTYDLGKVGDTYFIAMELVPGRNLREILKHCAMVAGHMPLPIAMNIVNQIADALDYAHNLCDETGQPLGIIHRDVSPANVIASEGGVVKLIDFGIAKASGGGMQTLSGMIKGKFSYLAPECLVGQVDARADLFALGVIAHELLSNRPLLQGRDDMDTLYRVKNMPILPPSHINPNVPPEIEAIIMTALERDPDKRWQRATAMRQALTTETQRLGLTAHNTQVEDWIASAFQKQFNEDSEPSIVISRNTVELAHGTVNDEFHSSRDSQLTFVKPSGSRPMPAEEPKWREPTSEPMYESDNESTIDEHQPVLHTNSSASQFDAMTVANRPNDRLAAEWNSPSSVQTVSDRPPASAWDHPNNIETREVKTAPTIERRVTSPHVIQRSTGSNQALRRPSSPQPVQVDPRRPSAPQPVQADPRRPSSPQPVQADPHRASGNTPQIPQGRARTAPHASVPPPAEVPLSGSRTSPVLHLGPDAAKTDVTVGASDVIHETDVGSVLADLEQRSSVAPSLTARRTGASRGGGKFLLALLVLIVAGGAAAVVYFALPYLT